MPDCAPTLVDEPEPPPARPLSPFGPLLAPIEDARFTVFFGFTVGLTVVVAARVWLDGEFRL